MSDRSILLVEDNPDDVALTMRAFAKNGFANRVEVATTGQQALDALLPEGGAATAGSPPALVLLDLNLPVVDGLEVLARLRADPRTRVIPVVILTSSKEPSDLDRAYRLGANSYIRKPVVFAEFVEAVRQLGLYWLVLNEVPEGTP